MSTCLPVKILGTGSLRPLEPLRALGITSGDLAFLIALQTSDCL